jgi:hypothetical protein
MCIVGADYKSGWYQASVIFYEEVVTTTGFPAQAPLKFGGGTVGQTSARFLVQSPLRRVVHLLSIDRHAAASTSLGFTRAQAMRTPRNVKPRPKF